ncbi:MAG: hypothetical protein E7219_04875 [Clostridiales bacterium]|nr:hypothetical protein [Clostridiales bacterium]
MNLREEVKDIIDNKPTKEDRKKAAAEARAKHMREKERALSGRGGLLPKDKGYMILLILMGLVAVSLLVMIIVVDSFPTDLTMLIVALMVALLLVSTFLMARRVRWKRIAGVVIAVLFLVMFGAASYYMGSTYAMMNKISDSDSFANAERKSASIDPTEEAFNIYITGIDQYEGEKGLDLERSDVNMIVTVNPQTKEILLTSIPRDTYVKLHTTQQMDKLTHTGIYGVDETLNTVEDWLGVDLDYYVKLNFSGARDVINAMGGIDVYSPVEFKSSLKGYKYEKGWNHLNGKRALYFARERHAFEGQDSIRVENQQRVLKAMIKKMTSSTTLMTRYGDIMAAAGSNLHTDMSYNEIRQLIRMQMTDLADWEVSTQKIEGEYDMDYVASLTQSAKFNIYRPDSKSVKKCLDAIDAVQNPPADEVKAKLEEREKGFIVNVVKRLLRKEEEPEDTDPIET